MKKYKYFVVFITLFLFFYLNVNAIGGGIYNSSVNDLKGLSDEQEKNLRGKNGNELAIETWKTWDKTRVLCTYGDQESKVAGERDYILFFAISTNSTLFVSNHRYDLDSKGNYALPYPRASDEEDTQFLENLNDCPEIIYYFCEKSSKTVNNNSKYSYYGNCFYYFEPFSLDKELVGNTEGLGKLKKSDVFTGEWKLNSEKSLVNVETGITTYISLTTNKKIYIQNKSNDDIKVVLDKNELEVSNKNDYKESFNNEEKDKYPIYLIEKSDSSYEFIESLNNQSEEIKNRKEVYVNVNYLNRIHGLGDEEITKTCSDIFGETFLIFINNTIVKGIQIGVPILLIILTIVDFAKVVFIDDKEGIQNAVRRFKKRGIAALLIFLTPYILIWIIKIVAGPQSVESCIKTINNLAEESEKSN